VIYNCNTYIIILIHTVFEKFVLSYTHSKCIYPNLYINLTQDKIYIYIAYENIKPTDCWALKICSISVYLFYIV